MNAHTAIVPCVDTLTKGLLKDMRHIWRSALCATDDERLEVLKRNYQFNQFVKGRFFIEEDALIFQGELGTCKTEVKVPK